MAITKDTFKHVDYLWDDEKAKALGNDQVALLLYRSNNVDQRFRWRHWNIEKERTCWIVHGQVTCS